MDLAINNSDLWENVFAEMMRYDPVVHAQFRYTTREIKIYNDVIPERRRDTLPWSREQDERAFKNPDDFDILRDDLHMGRENRSGRYKSGKNGHLGFGIGQHFCRVMPWLDKSLRSHVAN